MKLPVYILLPILTLTACALTPEQQAARQAAQQKREQQLQIALAQQCDPEAAQLIQQSFQQPNGISSASDKTLRLRYLDKVSNPVFQACYKLAWQNYIAQQKLHRLHNYYDRWEDSFYPFRSPLYRPWWH